VAHRPVEGEQLGVDPPQLITRLDAEPFDQFLAVGLVAPSAAPGPRTAASLRRSAASNSSSSAARAAASASNGSAF
jgi:hypothetical protein